jgi:hypothetical protein
LSTTQNTRSALAYGSRVMTCSTSRANGGDAGGRLSAAEHLASVHVPGGQVGHRPPRSYSCSTRIILALPGGRVGWQRQRAWMEVFSSEQST